MSITLIGIIKNKKGKIIGYRLIDKSNNKVKDCDINQTSTLIRDLGVNGLSLNHSKIVIDNSNLSNYPSIVDDFAQSNSPLTVLSVLKYYNKTAGYAVSDYLGNISYVTKDYLISYQEKYGVSNGIKAYGSGYDAMEIIIEPFENVFDITNLVDCRYKDELMMEIIKEKIDIVDSSLTVKLRDDTILGKIIAIKSPYGYIEGYINSKTDSNFWINHIEVGISQRNKGIGTQLYNKLEKCVIMANIATVIKVGVEGMVDTMFFKSVGFNIDTYTDDDLLKPESAILSKILNIGEK